jgi:hypothetical protein
MQEISKKIEQAKRPKIYLKIAEILRNLTELTTVAEIAQLSGVEYEIVGPAIKPAKLWLATQGVIVTNVPGYGYKVGNFDDFKVEIDRACNRALAQCLAARGLIGALEGSGKVDADFKGLRKLIQGNIEKIDTLFETEYDKKGREWEESLGIFTL